MSDGKENNMEPIRILHVLGTLNLGGAESRIMDLYRNTDRDKVQFDFLIHSNEPQHYEEEVRALGGRIYRLPRFRGYNYISYRKAICDFFASHQEFKAVHGHMTSTASIYLPIAKKKGIPMTIAHARSAGVDPGWKGRLTLWLRRRLAEQTDYCFTCSSPAGEAVFGKKAMDGGRVQIIPNAIEAKKYQFNPEIREKLRKELKIEDKLVIGHVGRFSFMKNHKFLLEVFAELEKREKNIVLLLLGEGEGMDEIRTLAGRKEVEDKVIFLGNRKNVQDYYQAMDYFVFPSIFEGLPGTVVEAQAAGLPCLISDTITKEVILTPLVKNLSLKKTAEEWAEILWTDLEKRRKDEPSLNSCLEQRRLEEKEQIQRKIREAGFDAAAQAKEMTSFYETAQKKRLLLMVPMLHQGGFERVCVLTARLLQKDFQVFICVFDLSNLAYDIDGIPVFHLELGVKKGKLGKVLNVFKRCRKVAELKKRLDIDVTYSFGPTANLINVLSQKKMRLIKKVTGAFAKDQKDRERKGQVWCGIRSYMDLDSSNHRTLQLFTKGADRIVSCSKVIEEELKEKYGCQDIVTLYNPYDKESIFRQSEEIAEDFPWSVNAKRCEENLTKENIMEEDPIDQLEDETEGLIITSMGREDDIKGFWHLIKSFFLVEQKEKEARLMIIGDGEFLEYKKLVKELGIEDKVWFTGLKKNPYPYLKQAGVYVLTSYHEGFPNALVEAMILGIPVISTDCKTGPREILEDQYGILIPNMCPEKNLDPGLIEEEEKQLADHILRLWKDKTEYTRYAKMAVKRSGDFSFEAYRQQFCRMMEGR